MNKGPVRAGVACSSLQAPAELVSYVLLGVSGGIPRIAIVGTCPQNNRLKAIGSVLAKQWKLQLCRPVNPLKEKTE